MKIRIMNVEDKDMRDDDDALLCVLFNTTWEGLQNKLNFVLRDKRMS